MPEIQNLTPKGDIDEDYRFVVRCNRTVDTVTGIDLRFIFRGPYNRDDISPSAYVDATAAPLVEVTDIARKEITCSVTGFTLPSGEYHGVLKKTTPGARATFARWVLQVRSDQTG